MPMTEEMRKLILEADDCALVFGRPGATPLLLFILESTDEQNAEATEIATRNRLDFCGLFAMVAGKPVTKCASVEAIPVMALTASTYAGYIAAKMIAPAEPSQKKKNDSVSWLERLMQLPDTREKFGSA